MTPESTKSTLCFSTRKSIGELSVRAIQNNGNRMIDMAENIFGEDEAADYIKIAYSMLVKNKKNKIHESRQYSQ